MRKNITEQEVKYELSKRQSKAEKMLENEDKLEKFLSKAEKKLKSIPSIGESLAQIPQMISLINAYVKHEYTDISPKTIIVILSAIIYFVSPIDMIPDTIPVLGFIDDGKVLQICLNEVQHEIDMYINWKNNK